MLEPKNVEKIFKKDTEDHEIHVMHNYGVYRHLVFKRPGAYSCYERFELVTFPGSLVYTGDCGTYTFSRTNDMFHFFNKKNINPEYWGEKCTSEDIHSRMVEYSVEVWEEEVRELVQDWAEERRDDGCGEDMISAQIEAVEEDILSVRPDFELEARKLIDDFMPINHADGHPLNFDDFWEIRLTKATHRYIWACHAIRWGVEQFFNN